MIITIDCAGGKPETDLEMPCHLRTFLVCLFVCFLFTWLTCSIGSLRYKYRPVRVLHLMLTATFRFGPITKSTGVNTRSVFEPFQQITVQIAKPGLNWEDMVYSGPLQLCCRVVLTHSQRHTLSFRKHFQICLIPTWILLIRDPDPNELRLSGSHFSLTFTPYTYTAHVNIHLIWISTSFEYSY